jgi:hypothetical protein
MLLWSGWRAFLDFGGLFQQLSGKSFTERGAITINEWQSFLARSGRLEQQTVFSEVHRAIVRASQGGKIPVHVVLSANGMAIIDPRCALPVRRVERDIIVIRSIENLPSEMNGSEVIVYSEREFASGVGQNWKFAFQNRPPADAKIFLNEPSFALYLISTFVWYPNRIDFTPEYAVIRDDNTFDAAFAAASSLHREDLAILTQELRALGYSHLVTRMDGVLKVLNLRDSDISN